MDDQKRNDRREQEEYDRIDDWTPPTKNEKIACAVLLAAAGGLLYWMLQSQKNPQ